MPAGNDAAAHAEFKSSVESQYGPYQNAEEMIRAHAGTVDPGVRRASLTQIDPDATDALREKGTSKVEAQFKGVPDGWTLEDFAVRGNAVVGIFLDEDGVHHKRVAPANDRYKEPEVSPDVAAQLARGEHDRRVAAETARLRAEADQRIAEVRAEEEARVQKELAKIQEQAAADLADATSEAQAAAGDGEKAESGSKRSGGAGASASRAAGGSAAKDK